VLSSPSPTKKQVSSFIMNRGTRVSSLITNKGKITCPRLLPTMERRCVRPLPMKKWWCVSFITNEWAAVCLRLSPIMDKCCVSACHEGRKEPKRSRYYNMSLKHHMIRQHHYTVSKSH
jgi:hypothetical protein